MRREEALKELYAIAGKLGTTAMDYLRIEDGDKMCEAVKALEQPEQRWISVKERLPEDFCTYLITLENGEVCTCEFNPDFEDEEHPKGAFTYYNEYFDKYTLGSLGSDEMTVDAVAWMPFEPFEEDEE